MENKVSYSVRVEDAVAKINLEASVDIVELARDMAAKSGNSVDDYLVHILELARKNLDWKGYAKEHLIDVKK